MRGRRRAAVCSGDSADELVDDGDVARLEDEGIGATFGAQRGAFQSISGEKVSPQQCEMVSATSGHQHDAFQSISSVKDDTQRREADRLYADVERCSDEEDNDDGDSDDYVSSVEDFDVCDKSVVDKVQWQHCDAEVAIKRQQPSTSRSRDESSSLQQGDPSQPRQWRSMFDGASARKTEEYSR